MTWLRRLGLVLLGLIAFGSITYLADFAWLRWRFARHGDVFGKVEMRYLFQVPRKDGKEEYYDDDPRTQTCVKSLYPHSAVPPCWYLERNRERRVKI